MLDEDLFRPEGRGRVKRLLFGYFVGAVSIGAGVFVAASVSASTAPAPEDDIVDVQLAPSATVESAPEPPPPPAPVAAPQPRARAAITAPKQVPTTAPAESEAPRDDKPSGPDPYGDGKGGVVGGDPNGAPGGTGTLAAPAAPPPPPPVAAPPPPPKPTGPVQVSENMVAPVAISNAPPSIANGTTNGVLSSLGVEELTVVVKYVISETGDVTSAVVARGNSALDAQILAAVKAWKFKPAFVEGSPVSVSKVAKFRFKLKT